tara:strand:+ start:3718 stop:3876 length:159 start_codon:yes stop_codon:yes gene_type:complete
MLICSARLFPTACNIKLQKTITFNGKREDIPNTLHYYTCILAALEEKKLEGF